MKYSRFLLSALTVLSSSAILLQTTAQTPPTAAPGRPAAPGQTVATPAAQPSPSVTADSPSVRKPAIVKKNEKLYSFKFEGSNLDIVMETYCDWTEQIYLKNDAVKATITLKADNLTKQECIDVVQAILGMNNIAIVPMGEKFIKVVQATSPDIGGKGLKVNFDPETPYGGSEKLVTHIIQLKHVEIPEVQAAVQHLMNAAGKIQALTRSNSMMITDTEANIIRIRELIKFMDQAAAQIEPRIYQIKYAEAPDIASKINEIVTAAQADKKTTTPVVTGNPYARTPPGVVRAAQAGPKAPTQATISTTEEGTTAIIQGAVKVMADERTNIIIIFSQEENFSFFDKIIAVLDVEVEPAKTFEVVNLEYADAVDLSGTLNDLIGAASSSRSTTSRASGSSSRSSGSSSRGSGNTSRSSSSRTSTQGSSRGGSSALVAPKADPVSGESASIENLNRLSEDTKILADERSNSILLMGEKADIAAIKKVIASLDVMLEQVLIETAIFEVTLGDTLDHGIEWLYQEDNKLGAWDGLGTLATNSIGTIADSALTYFQNLTGIDTKLAINLAAGDSNVRLLSTPVIMTTDNTEARLSVGEQRPVVTTTSSFANSSGTQSSSYEYRDIGIQLTVTPRINPQRMVVMEILQQADQVGDTPVTIDGNEVPVILNREFEAQIAVPDRGTIALGGLVNTEWRDSTTKIPILGDIPLIGRYLFSSVNNEERQTELIVLMTPYVLTTEKEMLEETERIYDAIDMRNTDWHGWSDSPLQQREKPDQEEAEEDYF